MNCGNNVSPAMTGNLVYLDKIYYNNTEASCPILCNLTTSKRNFTQQLTIGSNSCGCGSNCGCGGNCGTGCGCGCGGNCGCGCGGNCGNGCCCDFTITEDTTFNITKAFVMVNSFDLAKCPNFDEDDVTVDGFPVTNLEMSGGKFVADLSGIMGEITKCQCDTDTSCTCNPLRKCNSCNVPCHNDGHFVMVQVPGPWVVNLTIVLEGTLSDNGNTCNFKLCLRTRIGSEETPITVPGSNNFALRCVEIPCQTGGVSPSLVFDFEGCASLLNPMLEFKKGGGGGPGHDSAPGGGHSSGLVLTGTLVITPEIHLQVIKPALFNLNATEVNVCCDDVGQCNPCDPDENCCRQDCECISSVEVPERHSDTVSRRNTTRTGGSTSGRFPSACQCCDTNGYTF